MQRWYNWKFSRSLLKRTPKKGQNRTKNRPFSLLVILTPSFLMLVWSEHKFRTIFVATQQKTFCSCSDLRHFFHWSGNSINNDGWKLVEIWIINSWSWSMLRQSRLQLGHDDRLEVFDHVLQRFGSERPEAVYRLFSFWWDDRDVIHKTRVGHNKMGTSLEHQLH